MFFDFPTGLYHSICNYTDIGLWQIYPFCYKLQKNRSLFKISCTYIPKAHPRCQPSAIRQPAETDREGTERKRGQAFFHLPASSGKQTGTLFGQTPEATLKKLARLSTNL